MKKVKIVNPEDFNLKGLENLKILNSNYNKAKAIAFKYSSFNIDEEENFKLCLNCNTVNHLNSNTCQNCKESLLAPYDVRIKNFKNEEELINELEATEDQSIRQWFGYSGCIYKSKKSYIGKDKVKITLTQFAPYILNNYFDFKVLERIKIIVDKNTITTNNDIKEKFINLNILTDMFEGIPFLKNFNDLLKNIKNKANIESLNLDNIIKLYEADLETLNDWMKYPFVFINHLYSKDAFKELTKVEDFLKKKRINEYDLALINRTFNSKVFFNYQTHLLYKVINKVKEIDYNVYEKIISYPDERIFLKLLKTFIERHDCEKNMDKYIKTQLYFLNNYSLNLYENPSIFIKYRDYDFAHLNDQDSMLLFKTMKMNLLYDLHFSKHPKEKIEISKSILTFDPVFAFSLLVNKKRITEEELLKSLDIVKGDYKVSSKKVKDLNKNSQKYKDLKDYIDAYYDEIKEEHCSFDKDFFNQYEDMSYEELTNIFKALDVIEIINNRKGSNKQIKLMFRLYVAFYSLKEKENYKDVKLYDFLGLIILSALSDFDHSISSNTGSIKHQLDDFDFFNKAYQIDYISSVEETLGLESNINFKDLKNVNITQLYSKFLYSNFDSVFTRMDHIEIIRDKEFSNFFKDELKGIDLNQLKTLDDYKQTNVKNYLKKYYQLLMTANFNIKDTLNSLKDNTGDLKIEEDNNYIIVTFTNFTGFKKIEKIKK